MTGVISLPFPPKLPLALSAPEDFLISGSIMISIDYALAASTVISFCLSGYLLWRKGDPPIVVPDPETEKRCADLILELAEKNESLKRKQDIIDLREYDLANARASFDECIARQNSDSEITKKFRIALDEDAIEIANLNATIATLTSRAKVKPVTRKKVR